MDRLSRPDEVILARGDPTDCLRRWWQVPASVPRILLVEFELSQYWLDGAACR